MDEHTAAIRLRRGQSEIKIGFIRPWLLSAPCYFTDNYLRTQVHWGLILTERRQSRITGVSFCGYSLLNILHVCMDGGRILLYYFWNLHYVVVSYLYKKHMHVGHAPTSFQLCGLSPITSNKGRNVSSRCLNKSQVFSQLYGLLIASTFILKNHFWLAI